MPRLLGIGSALIDILAFVPDTLLEKVPGRKGGTELIDFDELERLRSLLPATIEHRPGGSAANTAAATARLGLVGSAMLAKTGADEDGRVYRRLLEQQGVDVRRFKTHPGLPTGCCICFITPDSQRTMRTYLGAASTLAPEDLTPADFEGFDLVHVEGYQLFNPDLMRALLEHARSAGAKVSMDLSAPEIVEQCRSDLDWILPQYVDVVLANEDEAAAYIGRRDPEEAVRAFAESCELAAVKMGERGAWIATGARVTHVPAERVRAVDSTGAGDLWAAGFLSGILAGRDPLEAARIGAMLGAAVVRQVGAHLPEAVWQTILERLKGEFSL